ncbi:MAG: YeeE/YedE thiosulfate transporter family protein [Limnohabitans sp.]|nr:YeeE/YedE thiosulfate transporter family protein [Limnohabitans sp.]
MEFITNTWHWSISGFLIGLVMLLLTYFGKTFGMSSNLRTMCSMAGGSKTASYFNFDWREQKWNLAVVLGAIVGGFIAYHYLSGTDNVNINPKTIAQLQKIGIDAPNGKYLPNAIFSIDSLLTVKGFLLLLLGGFLIGFGTPYAGGCTSGHAISGLSNLQLPSLIAVIGFFLGGLVMAHFLIPILF